MQRWIPRIFLGILMMIMVVQAVVTVAFVHHSEETGTEYVSFGHDTSGDIFQVNSDGTEKTSLDDVDCHHCCHCTGIFSYLTNGGIYAVLSNQKRFGYIFKLPSTSISPDLRPPIL